jgi:hypothetical protein
VLARANPMLVQPALCQIFTDRRSIDMVSLWFELMGPSSVRLMMAAEP